MWGRNPILWTSHFCQNLYSQGPNFCQVPATCPSKLFSCEMFRVRSHCNQTKINQPLIPLISSYNFLPTLFQETIPVMKKLEDDASVEEALVMLLLQVKLSWLMCSFIDLLFSMLVIYFLATLRWVFGEVYKLHVKLRGRRNKEEITKSSHLCLLFIYLFAPYCFLSCWGTLLLLFN